MSAFGWSDLPPEGSKGVLKGSKTVFDKNFKIIEGICELGGLRDLRGHFGPLACI